MMPYNSTKLWRIIYICKKGWSFIFAHPCLGVWKNLGTNGLKYSSIPCDILRHSYKTTPKYTDTQEKHTVSLSIVLNS